MLSTLNRRATLLSDPFQAVRRNVQRHLELPVNRDFSWAQHQIPISIYQNEDHTCLEIDLPGIRQDDIDLTVKGGKLWIRAERKPPEQEADCQYDERRYGRFERVAALDQSLDPSSVEAVLENGVLRLTLSKKPEARPVRIAVKSKNGTGTGSADR